MELIYIYKFYAIICSLFNYDLIGESNFYSIDNPSGTKGTTVYSDNNRGSFVGQKFGPTQP